MNDQPRRILLVEDDRFLRKAAETTLKQQGYTVITAADGEEALRVARSAPPDLILLDVIMPKLNGFQVLDALKKDPTTAHIPVIILSNLGQDRDVQQAMEAGATAYFIKADLSLQALVQRVGEPSRPAAPEREASACIRWVGPVSGSVEQQHELPSALAAEILPPESDMPSYQPRGRWPRVRLVVGSRMSGVT